MIKLFEEFIKYSDYKKWKDYYNKPFYDLMGEWFKKISSNHNKNYTRIYYDLKVAQPDEIKPPQEFVDFMKWYGYPFDFYEGTCIDKDGRTIRIGKLLTKLNELDLLKIYNDSKSNVMKNYDNLQVVISRHPYDIIGMSTNRGWKTCVDLNDKRYGGKYIYRIEELLKEGCLIAYLIRKDDRNIRNPISRCLINSTKSQNSYFLSIDSHIYGFELKEFRYFLKKWTNNYENNNK